MPDYKKIVEDALKRAKKVKNPSSKTLNESVVYPDGLNERMHPDIESDLANHTHSLGKHPIFPEGDESSFEEKIMGERFGDVVKQYKRAYGVDYIDNGEVVMGMMPVVYETIGLESKHKKALEKLAEKMVREEYNMDKSVVEIHAELVSEISLEGTKKNPTPITHDVKFKNHDEMVSANGEVYKRRFLNAMTQGAAKKSNHMFHMVDDDLTNLDPRIPNLYSKMMSSADYMYYIKPDMENGIAGGVVKVQFPTQDNPKAIIWAQAITFPVLVHELIKGVMELLSAHGLPKDKKIGEYVIDKADYLQAEPSDMRLGSALWGKFTDMIEPENFNLKHHIYSELAALRVNEFNTKMREIMAGTKEGKTIIDNIVKDVKTELKEDEYNEAMSKPITKEDGGGYGFEDLFGGKPSDDDDDDGGGISFDDLFGK